MSNFECVYYYLKVGGVLARGCELGTQFLVEEGSTVAKRIKKAGTYSRLREKLCKKGVIKNGRFAKSYTFTSPTQAGNVILGTKGGGPANWLNDRGVSLTVARKHRANNESMNP